MQIRVVTLLVFWIQLYVALGANILYIQPCPSSSHHIWNVALAKEIVKKGHNVTMISHNDEKKPIKNLHIILMEGIYENTPFDLSFDNLAVSSPMEDFRKIFEFSDAVCEHDFNTKGFQTLLAHPEDYKFDLIIFDVSLSVCFYPFIDRFNSPPVVAVTPFLLPPALSHVFGNPIQTAYMPYYSTDYSDRMTFTERFYNSFYIYAELFYRQYYSLPSQETLARKHFSNKFRSFHEIERSISILLSNTDPNLVSPLDLPPNIIPVGGLQIQPAKPLPEDLQQILDSAEHGVVLFTLGSILRSDQFNDVKRTALLKAFSRLPQTILWKFETHDVIDLPKNVFIRKWLPQSDILAHPNTRVFITHGGALGTQEAMYHGVPILAIPFIGDQIANAGRFVNKKMGLMMSYHNITEENVYSKLQELLNNPIYTDNIKLLAKRYKDQQNSPMERAVYWIEYVLRHGNAEHLNLAARDMNILQALNLDILACILLILLAICSLFVRLVRNLRSWLAPTTKKVKLS